ncbi:MAG TPA: sigma 54-interacting transcriptional regulator [Myxococcota bacterium]|nr:sigma 54-interacting transcriptional regulator [Myxococcota bacterium]
MIESGSRTAVTSVSRSVTLSGICLRIAGQPDFLIDSDTVTVGAARECDLVIDDPGVSRTHFQILRRPEGWLLRDLKSTNGTMVERARVVEAWLSTGMTITIGRTSIEFMAVSDMAPVSASASEGFGDAVGRSQAMREIFTLLERVSQTDATVLIEGETGSGKEVIARGIHDASRRAQGPFVVFDCGATPRDLVESILFGHERGAFTGAVTTREGLFEQADGGTLFLDELGELPPEVQPKLLRILETREVRRVGGSKARKVSVRLVAATNRRLESEVAAGRFRADLFFRLAVIRVTLPALKDRIQDIPLLVSAFTSRRKAVHGSCPVVSDRALSILSQWNWPGNVRELFNALERAASLCPGSVVDVADLPPYILDAVLPGRKPDNDGPTAPLDRIVRPWASAREDCINRFEREYLADLMEKCGGNLTVAARCADLDRKHLRNLLKKHGLYRGPEGRADGTGDMQD